MTVNAWTVQKFGGSSLADPDCFRRVRDIIVATPGKRIGVVVSAMAGMTDELLSLTHSDQDSTQTLALIENRYRSTAEALLGPEALPALIAEMQQDCHDITQRLQHATPSPAAENPAEVIAGYGEIWSARLLAALLAGSSERPCQWLDARQVIVVRTAELGPAVDWRQSRDQLARALPADFSGVAVMTGFIARHQDGYQTTLGRNGSDYSAAILAALTQARELVIWSDVDGVMSADPRRVPEAKIIDRLSYNEAMELAYFGARIIHPQTLGPAISNAIPVSIRNTFAPHEVGSLIGASSTNAQPIKGITEIDQLALINVEGNGMIGVPGTADRLFAALKHAGISVTLISQASSEHSICIAVPEGSAQRAKEVIVAAFHDELRDGQLQRVDLACGQSIIAVVGDGMAGSPGLAAKFFGTLGRAGINVRAIAQGSSERNISAVIDSADATRALRAAHSGFYLSAKTLSIGLIGPGAVGGTLLQQISSQAERIQGAFNLDLRIRAIAQSRRMLLGERQIDLDDWRQGFENQAIPLDLEQFQRHVLAEHLPHSVIIDCSADQTIAARYPEWLSRGIHIVTPNKKAFSGSLDDYRSLFSCAASGHSHVLYETTVGAALPILTTLRELIDTGDEVHSVQGILSGTLSYLFNSFDGTRPFSEVVREARDKGYTEPDPRDDLSGMDVARKLVILGREMGLDLELADLSVESLIPPGLEAMNVEQFLEQLAGFDSTMQERWEQAQARGQQLRYVANLNANGQAAVALRSVDSGHPFGNIRLTDNIVQFVSDRYADNPLVVQGPGAGPDVTAGGVFADLLRLANYLSGSEQ